MLPILIVGIKNVLILDIFDYVLHNVTYYVGTNSTLQVPM